MDDDERCAEASLEPGRDRRAELRAAPAAKGGVVCWRACGLDVIADAEATERFDRVGPQRDARADLPQLGRALEDEDFAAGSLERDRGCEAADSGADHQGAIVHVSRLWGALAARVGDLASPSGPGYDRRCAFRQRGRVGCCRGPHRSRRVLAQRHTGGSWRARRRQVSAARARDRARDGDAGAARRRDRGRVRARVRRAAPARSPRPRPRRASCGAAGGGACRGARSVSCFSRGPLPDRRGGSRTSRGGR